MSQDLQSRRRFMASLGAMLLAAGTGAVAAQEATEEAGMAAEAQVFDLFELADEQNRSFSAFLREPAMDLGIYKLPADERDTQGPHRRDEAYYVISGEAKIELENEDEPQDVGPGSLVFVPKDAQHRFVDIEDDLVLLVIFAPGTEEAS